MKTLHNIYNTLLLAVAATLASCVAPLGEADEPNTDDFGITSPTSVGDVNITIREVKDKYCANTDNADYVRNSSNFYAKINEDLVFEGVVCANDVSGNLYQQLFIRNIDPVTGEDQCISLGLKSSALYLYFSVGQRVKVNLKGLYAGCYSKVPKIGQPYVTSYGNLSLGAALIEMARTNIELVGKPDPTCPECQPVNLADDAGDAWLRTTASTASTNKLHYRNFPQLVTVRGKIKEVQGANANNADTGEVTGKTESLPKTFGPEVLRDAGFGIDRTLMLQSNSTTVTVRTSTRNEISFTPIPADTRTYTGVLTYYSNWQIQLRSLADMSEPLD